MKVISNGSATCIVEPRGADGLEGYSYNTEYKFERCDRDKKGRVYMKIYPSATLEEDFRNDYYETCSLRIFKKHFRIVMEKSNTHLKKQF